MIMINQLLLNLKSIKILTNIQYYDFNKMRKNKRSSSQHQSTILASQQTSILANDLQNIKKMLQDNCYKVIRMHVKQNILQFQQSQLKQVYKTMSRILKILDQRKSDSVQNVQKQNNDLNIHKKTIQELKQKIEKQRQKHSQVIRQMIQSNQAQISYTQSQYNKKIIFMQKDFQQKQSRYQQLINKFTKTLSVSQQSFQRYKKSMENKNQILKKTIMTLTDQIKVQKSKLFNNLIGMIQNSHQTLRLKLKQNTNFLNKNNHDSGFSDSQSYQTSSFDMENSIKKLKHQKNNNCQNSQPKNPKIDLSSIQKIFGDEDSGQFNQGFQQLVQRSLFKLICFGFFSQENQTNCKNLLHITKNLNHYSQIFSHTLYPLILQNIKMVLSKNESIGNQLLFQNTDQTSQYQNCNIYQNDDPFNLNGKVSDFNSQGPIQFRNIQNLRDLDVSDSVL